MTNELENNKRTVRAFYETAFNLQPAKLVQTELFADVDKRQRLVQALDAINDKWGNYTIFPARMIGAGRYMPDRISFGAVKELVEATHRTHR
ncbi:MAG: hypothetical protein MN733_31330 [Nitrososphaera sp.]|nr:hypothetical protein [Nitrososphaera sp.]